MEKLQWNGKTQNFPHSFAHDYTDQYESIRAKFIFFNCWSSSSSASYSPFPCTSLIYGSGARNYDLQGGGVMIRAVRRRRSNTRADTYVLMEPEKSEEFVSEQELRERLKGWLENWPGGKLPADLARFDTVEEAVDFLVKSVCELEIDDDVGSIQWYQAELD